ncbi:alpha-galactosidase [Butyrivibrio sp. INlla16]|uniref:alpha-galactosidase n=1 Tax=Butyrivibrio sp. INlla16 TaxID=1520807 RepID=UPI000890FC64|nr:alpha-galactosidase [Butyrivibrio sp. INlla16]SDB61177.1 alpha-galactosidase [Butyrivibrio sp. INlla16]
MNIICNKSSGHFHLYNDRISYIIAVAPSGELTNIYFGKRIHDRDNFSYVIFQMGMPNIAVDADTESYSMELNRQEYPSFGTTDFGMPAFEVETENGSRISSFVYKSHSIYKGKKELTGLPATYANEEKEAMTLEVLLEDEQAKIVLTLFYTIFDNYPVVARHAEFRNEGKDTVKLTKALSCCLDLPDQNYEMMQFTGAWARERIPEVRKLTNGITAVESKRGTSSANFNPFVIMKRPKTDDFSGEAFGFSFVYSGNFIAAAEGSTYGRLRIVMGINPERFTWILESEESFVTPEVVIAHTDLGLNDLSRTYHRLYNNNLVRGKWKNRPRPILNNNWEATYMDFTEESILNIASKAKQAGVELFVLDDGWFGERDDDFAGLGDWVENPKKLPQGMAGLSRKINAMGLDFGFWIEPEMVNPNSNLYRRHPEWVLAVPGRKPSLGRHQLVLDFSRKEVVDYIYNMLYKVISGASISYIKWDMNRPLTEVFSMDSPPEKQGMIYHKYVLGVYSLYTRLIETFPDILFESCSSGGNRFDAGMLYYAPQAWCSDNTDAIDRLRIQYGSSYGYPIVSIGSHVSNVPNQQTGRSTSIATRANVAYFGTYGYELDLNEISSKDFEEVKEQIEFMKKYRELIQFGDFYRLRSPFETDQTAWMVVSKDKKKAIVGFYCMKSNVNTLPGFLRLAGLDEETLYKMEDREYYGDELMNMGITLSEFYNKGFTISEDYSSFVSVIEAV